MMSELNQTLPTGWTEAKLHEVSETIFGQSPPSNTYNTNREGLPFFQGKAEFGTVSPIVEKWCTKPTRIAEAGDILISVRAPVGPTNLASHTCAIGRGLAAIRPIISRPYVQYYLKLTENDLASKGTGTTFKAITKDVLKNHRIKIAPLNEQKRIVDKIERLFSDLDEGEALLKTVQKQLATYRRSVLKAAVTGELTKDWREQNKHRLEHGDVLLQRILKSRRDNWQGRGKYQEPTAPDTANLPELPEGWVWATLPQLGEFGRGKSKHRPRNDPKLYENGKYPFLQTGTVRNSRGRIKSYDTMYNDLGLKQSKLWPVGTVCITIAANIAESGILEIEACFPDSVVGLIPDPKIYGSYVEFFIRTAKANLDRYAPATAQKNINLEILEKVAIPFPSTDEQKEIVDKVSQIFSQIDALENWCATELARSSTLRQSILKSAFSGKLVPQDPADEPARELLKRIQSARAAQPQATSAHGRKKQSGRSEAA